MPLQATSGAASYDAFGGGVPVEPVYIEQIFQTYLYTGNGTTQTITNGIDLSTKGGLVWLKRRDSAAVHMLWDTNRGAIKYLASNTTNAEIDFNSGSPSVSYNSTGFGLATTGFALNASGGTYASWTFRKQPKFFDVVTYTGTGSVQNISHNLGSAPGCIIVKDTTNSGSNWAVYHRSLNEFRFISLNLTTSETISSGYWNNTAPTSTQFTVGTNGNVNQSGATFVAYLFAHDAGGFGLLGTDNVITCGQYNTNGLGNATIDLGYEPQWFLHKRRDSTGNWIIVDNMRGFTTGGANAQLYPNLSNAESSSTYPERITSTGVSIVGDTVSSTNIYIAIRRGPMKVPTDGTSVFAPIATTASTGTKLTTNFPVDLSLTQERGGGGAYWMDKLRGALSPGRTGTTPYLQSSNTGAETLTTITNGWDNTGLNVAYFGGVPAVWWNFRRAPGFFDEVCYTGTSTDPQNYSHNLQAVPEMMIVRRRNQAGNYWFVYHKNLTAGHILQLQSTAGSASDTSIFTTTAPTASVFTVGGDSGVNSSAGTYVAYLFATCAGVSKVGSFTGNGSSQTINCGFTGGARFVMVKATSTTGDWMVADSARGIVSGSDPYLELNNTNAEVTGEDWLDTDSTGFVVNEVSGSNANTNGVTYIFLAIA